MIKKLNHIGIAVPNLQKAIETYRSLFKIQKITKQRIMPEMGIQFVFITLSNAQIELMEPYGRNSPLTGFLKKHGNGGQHHICYEVDDLTKERDRLLKQGARILGSGEPYIGAHNKPVLFIHPKDCDGVLVELMQV